MANTIQVGVVGVGHLGSVHARIYSQLKSVQLVAVCDIRPEQAREVARRSRCLGLSDLSAMPQEVQAVSIAVPTQQHFSVAKFFLSKGVHLLIEKPFTSTVEEAQELLALGEKSGAIIQVGHVERFNAALRKVADTLQDPRFVEVHRLAPFQPRGTEVGVVLDLMIHDIDILLGLVKNPIDRIEAVGVKVLTPFEDIANARINFKNGAVANLTASRISKEAMRKFRIFQAAGYTSIDLLSQAAEIYRLRDGQIAHETIRIPKEESLVAELASFIEAIQNNRPPIVSGREAKEALEVALTITQQIHHKPNSVSDTYQIPNQL